MNKKQWAILLMVLVPIVGWYFKVFALFLIFPLWLLRPKK